MTSNVSWVIFGIPLAGALVACFGMCFHWRDEDHFPFRPIAVFLAAAAASFAFGAVWYVAFIGPISSKITIVEDLGLLLSISGVVLGLKSFRPPQWFSVLALVVCAWMCVLFFLEVSTF